MLDTVPLLREFNESFGGSPRLFQIRMRFGTGAEAYRLSTSDGAGETGGPHG